MSIGNLPGGFSPAVPGKPAGGSPPELLKSNWLERNFPSNVTELMEPGIDIKDFIAFHRAADSDKDGKLSLDELKAYTNQLKNVSFLLKAKDFLGELTPKEKETLKQLNQQLEVSKTLKDNFGRFNQNGDEGITAQEIYEVAKQDGKPYAISWLDLIDFKKLLGHSKSKPEDFPRNPWPAPEGPPRPAVPPSRDTEPPSWRPETPPVIPRIESGTKWV